jgi:pyridoxal phosphate enzyme (YggS family)
MSIADNVALVRDQIESAARRAGRNPEEIELMAVTKTVPVERIREAFNAGIHLFGENRVQEFDRKVSVLRDLTDARWHMIGHLQTNKAARAAELFDALESVDSLRLAQKLNAAAAQLAKKLAVLIEINIGGEGAKSGVAADSEELEQLLKFAPSLPHLDFGGLMTVPPYSEDPERLRPFFRKMRELAGSIQRRGLPGISMNILSMGMSHDFEIAIEEGATQVRVGTALFGERLNQRSKA